MQLACKVLMQPELGLFLFDCQHYVGYFLEAQLREALRISVATLIFTFMYFYNLLLFIISKPGDWKILSQAGDQGGFLLTVETQDLPGPK